MIEMMSISSKLTLLVLVLPIAVLLLSDLALFYYHETSIEVSSLLTAIAVFLLVWERLRDSLSKKLNYLYDNYLSELYDSFKRGSILHFYALTVEKITPDLKRHGGFMWISLYPRGLLSMINSFLTVYEKFSSRLEKIESIGKELCEGKLNIYLWCHVLGIKNWVGAHLEQNIPMLKLHEEKAQLIKEKQAKIIAEAKEHVERAERIRKKILEKFEDFFKSNSLEIPEPFYDL